MRLHTPRLRAVLSTYKIVLGHRSSLLKVAWRGRRGALLQALELLAVQQQLWEERQLCGLATKARFEQGWLLETQGTTRRGWCLAPMVGKSVPCRRGGQPSASAGRRSKTDCVKETQMLKMRCIILSGDVYCKHHDECTTLLLAQLAIFFHIFFFLSALIVDKNPETLTQSRSYPERLKISHGWRDETKALMYQGCLNTSRAAIPWATASHRTTHP